MLTIFEVNTFKVDFLFKVDFFFWHWVFWSWLFICKVDSIKFRGDSFLKLAFLSQLIFYLKLIKDEIYFFKLTYLKFICVGFFLKSTLYF